MTVTFALVLAAESDTQLPADNAKGARPGEPGLTVSVAVWPLLGKFIVPNCSPEAQLAVQVIVGGDGGGPP